MPDGATHTKATLMSMLPVFAGVAYLVGWRHGVAVSGGMLFGDLLLSPDLDHRVGSQAYKLWGILRWIWLPYQRLTHHRAPTTHWPIIGTALRLAYLSAVPLAVMAATGRWDLLESMRPHASLALHAVAGIEIAAMLHYLLDWTS